jgi:hypothetical protein
MSKKSMNISLQRGALFALALFLTAGSLPAATITWNGNGDGVSWSDTANWSGGVRPGPADHAVITLNGTYSVKLSANTSVAGLTVGGSSGRQTFDARGFQLNLGTDSSIIGANALFIIGGAPSGTWFVLTIDGPLVVRGRMDWDNGTVLANTYYLPPNGRVITIAPGGMMRWIGLGDRYISATLENQGTLRWESGLTYYTQGYSVSSSGTFDIDLDTAASFARSGINSQGPWIFTNTGRVVKTGRDTARIGVELRTIGGSVEIHKGTLLQNYTSRWERATVSVDSGATLQLTSNRTSEPHTVVDTLSGVIQGTFVVKGVAGYHSTLSADTGGVSVINIGGTGLQLDFSNLGGILYQPGNRYTGGPTNIGLLRFVGGAEKSIDGPFVNKGTLRWESGRGTYYVTASFANEGLFEIDLDTNYEFNTAGINGGRPGPLVNTGTIRKIGRDTATFGFDLNTIGGLVDVQGGTLIQRARGRWEDATIAVSAGAMLMISANRTFETHVVAGTLRGDPQGTFLVSNVVYGYYTTLVSDTVKPGRLEIGGTGLQGSLIECGISGGAPAPVNGGLFRFVGGDNYQLIDANFRNEGRLQWESGSLRLDPTVLITNTGTFEISSNNGTIYGNGGGSVTNEASGIIRKIDTGTSTVATTLLNRGRLSVAQGKLVVQNTNTNEFTSTAEGIIAGVGVLDVRTLPPARLHNDGTTAPGPGNGGEGVGTLIVQGPLPEHRFEFELSGTDSALYDRLIVTGGSPDISLDTAYVNLLNGFTPAAADSFDVIIGPAVGQLSAVVSRVAGVGFTATYPVNIVRLKAGGANPTGSDTITVIAPKVTARQGERANVPITIIASSRARSLGATGVTFSLRFNATLLVPIESTPKGTIQGSDRMIDMQIPLSTSSDTTVVLFPFTATLGSDSTTALAITGQLSTGASLPVEKIDGLFRLLDLCYAGGARLLNPNGKVGLNKASPNPASGSITLEIELTELGGAKIFLTDMHGDVVKTFSLDDVGYGRSRIDLDVSDIASGIYALSLQTLTVRETILVEVRQ